jgi:imidazolonepropionase-like amidohydrolase
MTAYLSKWLTIATVTAAGLAAASVSVDPPRAYRARRIWTGDGPPIADGVLLVEQGKIKAVGPRGAVAAPPGTDVQDLGDAVLIPGLVVAQTALAERGQDDEQAITPEVRASDGFDPYEDHAAIVAGGVTTVQLSPGARRLIPGQGAVVKLAGSDPAGRTLSSGESLRVVLGDASKNPPRIFEPPIPASSTENPIVPTRAQPGATRAGAVAAVRATLRAAQTYRDRAAAKPRSLPLDAVLRYMGKERPVRVTAPEAVDVRAAMGLAQEFGLKLVLVDPGELEPFRSQFADWSKAGHSVVLDAQVRPGRAWNEPIRDKDAPPRRTVFQNARELLAAGLPVALRPSDDADLPDMLFIGGVFAQSGIPPEQVLAMLTRHPAGMLGVGDRVGSLAAGRDADFVVLSADPFATHTTVRAVYAGGRPVYESPIRREFSVVRAGTVYLNAGSAIRHGAVLVEGSKIRAVGNDVSAPADAAVYRYDDAVLVPGMLDLHSQLGIGTAGIALDTKVADVLPSSDPAMAAAREGGVTTAFLVPAGDGPAPVIALKLGDPPRVLKEPAAIKFTLSGNLTTQVAALRSTLERGRAYADSWTRYERAQAEYESKRREYDTAKAKADAAKKPEEKKEAPKKEESPTPPERKGESRRDGQPFSKGQPPAKEEPAKKEEPPKKEGEPKPADTPALPPEPRPPTRPNTDNNLEPYRALFAAQIPALVVAHRTDAIQAAVGLFRDQFKLRTVLAGSDDAVRVAELLAAKQVAVAVGPDLVPSIDGRPTNVAQVLAVRGVRFGFQSQGTTGSKVLPLAVTYGVRRGLGVGDALAGLTAWPAEMLAVDSQVGTLAAGRDADLVVLSGPPFELATRVRAVMIDGQWVYRAEEVR